MSTFESRRAEQPQESPEKEDRWFTDDDLDHDPDKIKRLFTELTPQLRREHRVALQNFRAFTKKYPREWGKMPEALEAYRATNDALARIVLLGNAHSIVQSREIERQAQAIERIMEEVGLMREDA